MIKIPNISFSLETTTINLIEVFGKNNRSKMVNNIIKRQLSTKEGIKKELEYLQEDEDRLKHKLQKIEEKEKKLFENTPEQLKIRLKEIKKIIDKQPDKVNIWTEVINRDYNLIITEDQLQKLCEKWG